MNAVQVLQPMQVQQQLDPLQAPLEDDSLIDEVEDRFVDDSFREEDEEDIDLNSNNPIDQAPAPPKIHRMDDPDRMDITDQEISWARAIKTAIEGDAEIDNLSDFMYVQLALIEKDNIEGALERAAQLQAFKEEYGILDTKSDGLKHLRDFVVKLFPKYILSFSFDSESTGSYVLIYDHKGFDIKALDTEAKLVTWLATTYYSAFSLCPDFESIRSGVVVMAECEGYNWTKNIDVKTYQRFWSEIGVALPVKFRLHKHFHCGVFINLLFSLTKKFLPSEITSKFDMGCQFDGRLDEIYLIPTVAAANQRLLNNMGEALERRYSNMKSYSLPVSGQ